MTDTLEANARCLRCDTPVHALCKSDAPRLVECTPCADGEWGLVAGRLKELPAGSMMGVGVMRFGDHHLRCKGSLRPEPKDVPTTKTRVYNRDR